MDAAQLLRGYDRILYSAICGPYDATSRQVTPHLLQAENSMLGLASLSCCESFFYLMSMLMTFDDQKYRCMRYFEHGHCRGYIKQHGSALFESALTEPAELLAIQVFTDWDVRGESSHRQSEIFLEVYSDDMTYRNLLKKNEFSIHHSLAVAV